MSWPDATSPAQRADASRQSSWPEAAPPPSPPSWPEATQPPQQPSWPDATRPGQPSQRPGAAQAQQPSWPDATSPAQPSWPEATQSPQQPSWPDATRPGQPSQRPGAAQAQQPSWPDATSPAQQPWPDNPRYEQPSWPDATAPSQQQQSRPEPVRQDPIPAWQEAPPAATGWANLNSPAPWPQADQPRQAAPAGPDTRAPQGAQAGAPPFDERTMQQPAFDERTMQQPALDGRGAQQAPYGGGTPLDDRAMPQGRQQPFDEQPGGGQPGGEQQSRHGRPGANLSRDPSDPDRPFVTAGQISGSRTPPPERQQQLWDTVFGDDYQSMGEPDSLDDTGKPIWIYALAGSVGVALVGALLWAFLAGPLAGDDAAPAAADPSASNSAAPPKKTSTSIGRLRTYAGNPAPVNGVVQSATAGISVPRLGGAWQLDQRTTVQATYGFETRQFSQVGETQAQLLTGPLPARMASAYTSGDDLEPVIKAVVVNARKRFFPSGNQVRKIAQQPIKVGDATGRLIAYSLTSDTQRATIVTIAVNSGNDLPAIVYMSVPTTGKQLLPDINTVVKQLKVTAR
ncbi:hypothetical protein [Nonomuraea cavernae]|uniref:hypothetical protein n=1 Tax=Nonomuraea cavernae TaxID=2045107 RepID=UPI00340801E5